MPEYPYSDVENTNSDSDESEDGDPETIRVSFATRRDFAGEYITERSL